MSYIKENTESPLKIFGAIGGLVGGVYKSIQAGKAAKKADRAAEKAAEEKARMRDMLSNVDTSNPFEGMQNQFAGLQNPYSGLENTMEDLTVNQQEADFQAQQFAQSQANIMDGLRGAAGSSGIAALAQSLAKQGSLAAQKSSASIGKQEAANQAMAAKEAGRLQSQEAKGDFDVAQAIAKGQADVDVNVAKGEQQSQQLEMRKQQALFQDASTTAANAEQAAVNAQAAKSQAIGDTIGSGFDLLGGIFSDKRLKKNIKLIGKSPSGLKIYAFEYIDKFFGEHVYQGVMSDEIPSNAIINNGGYDSVDYSKIDVEFKIL
tara:strand:- start:6717 stop:7673 length:957 start_codon:yes stop_codon:yes gene_type:complete